MTTILLYFVYILTLPHIHFFQILYNIICACYLYMFCLQQWAVYICLSWNKYHVLFCSEFCSEYCRYRWGMPDFPQRAHIALGLLEYAYITLEEENIRFYMCNLSPRTFGHSLYYEMKVTNLEGIVSESVLNQTFQNTSCKTDRDCVIGDLCHSTCDSNNRTCSGISKNYIPDTVKICRIIQDYILFDIPPHLKQSVGQYISDCIRIEKKSQLKSTLLLAVDENFAIDRLNKVLWDELKYSDMKWREPPTKKPRIS